VETEMSCVFLFGAGASYGSDTQRTPPIGATLFGELRKFNPDGWGSISGGTADIFRRDFEEGMTSMGGTALAPLQRAMAAYFFEFMPLKSNLYFEIGQRIARTSSWSGAACRITNDCSNCHCWAPGSSPLSARRNPTGADWNSVCLMVAVTFFATVPEVSLAMSSSKLSTSRQIVR
jgi:hypothetical protein